MSKFKKYDSPEDIKKASEDQRGREWLPYIESSPNFATKQLKKNKKRYCLFCHKVKKKRYILFGERICKNIHCPLREDYVHPFAPQKREGQGKTMASYHGSTKCPNLSKLLSVDDNTLIALNAVKTVDMKEMMEDKEWVKKYKIKE